MKWVWVLVTVLSGTIGDLVSAKGMSLHGELDDFRPRGLVRIMRYVVTHPLVAGGIFCNAIAFFSFMALLSVSDLSFAVPVTASSYILKTVCAKWYLNERITWRRWAGVVMVAIGIVLISV
ncbi:MAG TPA: DMT family transporter [Bryobacteraceae bacterium]|nr:DMT family transporter [Bryobacteraceae bacterium]HXR74665.1 DMT family transporter [Bryobacteraceae bacterium]